MILFVVYMTQERDTMHIPQANREQRANTAQPTQLLQSKNDAPRFPEITEKNDIIVRRAGGREGYVQVAVVEVPGEVSGHPDARQERWVVEGQIDRHEGEVVWVLVQRVYRQPFVEQEDVVEVWLS
jgi:hypothetical protein